MSDEEGGGEKEQDATPYLTYGCIIALEANHLKDQFVFSEGHVKPTVLLKTFAQADSAQSRTAAVAPPTKLSHLAKSPDFYQCLFQIYPKVNNTAKSQVAGKLRQVHDELINAQIQKQQALQEAQSREMAEHGTGGEHDAHHHEHGVGGGAGHHGLLNNRN